MTKIWKLAQPAALLIFAWMAMNNSYMAIFGVADLLLFYVMHKNAKAATDNVDHEALGYRVSDRRGRS